MPTFLYDAFADTDTDDTAVIWCHCDTEKGAIDLVGEIQSIVGSRLERDGSFLYCAIGAFLMPEAIEEIHGHGYQTEEHYG